MQILHWLNRAVFLRLRRRRRKTLFAMSERLELKTLLSAFVVTSPVDEPDALPGDGIAQSASGETTLRAAVQEANASPGPDEILIPDSLIQVALAASSGSETGELEIADDLTISGAGKDSTVIDATQIDTAFHIQTGVELTLSELTLVVTDDGTPGIFNDGGALTLNNADVDELPPLSIPAIDRSVVSTNERHENLLVGLFQPVVTRDEPLDPLFAPPPLIVSMLRETRSDATIAIGTERVRLRLIAGTDVDGPAVQKQNEHPPESIRTADDSPEVPSPITQRRRDVVNSLFQNVETPKRQGIQPVAGESPPNRPTDEEAPVDELQKMRKSFPMLIPLDEDVDSTATEEATSLDLPVPPLLPEPAPGREQTKSFRHQPSQAATSIAAAGILFTAVRPDSLRRAFRRLSLLRSLKV